MCSRCRSSLVDELASCGPGIHTLRFGRDGLRAENRRAMSDFLKALRVGKRWSPDERRILTPLQSAAHHAGLFERVVKGAQSQ